MKKTFIVGLCMVLLVVSFVSADIEYINITHPSCNNANSRIEAQNINTPWCDLNALQTESNLGDGDIVYVAEGDYNDEVGITLDLDSLTTNWTLKAYPGASVNVSSYVPDYAVEDNGLWQDVSGVFGLSNTWNTTYSPLDTDNPIIQFANETEFINTRGNCWDLTGCTKTDNYITFADYDTFPRVWADESTDEIRIRLPSGQNPNNMSLYILKTYQPFAGLKIYNFDGTGNLTIAGFNFKFNRMGLHFTDINDVVVEDNTFSEGYWALRFTSSTDGGLTIRNNSFYGNHPTFYQAFIKDAVEEDDCITTNNDIYSPFYIHNNYFQSTTSGISITTNSASEQCGSHVYNNTFNLTGYGGYESTFEIEQYCCNSTWEDNVQYGGWMGLSLGGANSTTNKCTFKNNIIALDDYIIYDEDTTYSTYPVKAYYVSANVVNWNITQNTFVGKQKCWYGIDNVGHERSIFDTYFTNNICYLNSTSSMIERTGEDRDGNFWDYNLYYDDSGSYGYKYWMNNTRPATYGTLAAAKAAGSWDGEWEVHSVEANPRFSNYNAYDFTLSVDSPACTMSSTGGYVGALPCGETAYTGPDVSSGFIIVFVVR